MFLLLLGYQILFLTYSLQTIVTTYIYQRMSETALIALDYSNIFCITFANIFQFSAHSVFVIKYWVIAKKVTQILSDKLDPWFECKANFMFYGQITLVITSQLGIILSIIFSYAKWPLNLSYGVENISILLIIVIQISGFCLLKNTVDTQLSPMTLAI